MTRNKLVAAASYAAVALAAAATAFAIASPTTTSQDAPPEMQLPPGWTQEDMQACIVAGTPGEQHAFLARAAGEWTAETTMWMYPGAEPMSSQGTATYAPAMDGRYVKCTMKGEIPGMGAYTGEGVYGYDNVAGRFVATWIDNHSTGIMNGTGELSEDGKTLTWTFTYQCPVTQKPAKMREVETIHGPDSRTTEMWGTDPKSGKEFRMMRIDYKRAGSHAVR